MVDPLRIIPADVGVDDATVIHVKEKSVVGLQWVMRMTPQRFCHADDLAHIFNHPLIRCHVARGKNAFAMHLRGQDFDVTPLFLNFHQA
jgi:hypothetical protein